MLRLEGGGLLVDRGVEEHREDGGGGAVDGHRHRGRGIAQIEAAVEHLHVVEGRDGDPRVADLPVDVGPVVGVESVQGDRIEGGREPLRLGMPREVVEALVRAGGVALAREHAKRVLALALEREHPGGEREPSGDVLAHEPAEEIALVAVARQGDLADPVSGEGGVGESGANRPPAGGDLELVPGVRFAERRPAVEEAARLGVEGRLALGGERLEGRRRARRGGVRRTSCCGPRTGGGDGAGSRRVFPPRPGPG